MEQHNSDTLQPLDEIVNAEHQKSKLSIVKPIEFLIETPKGWNEPEKQYRIMKNGKPWEVSLLFFGNVEDLKTYIKDEFKQIKKEYPYYEQYDIIDKEGDDTFTFEDNEFSDDSLDKLIKKKITAAWIRVKLSPSKKAGQSRRKRRKSRRRRRTRR